MRCIPRLLAFVCLALICAAPAYSVQLLYQTVRVDATVGSPTFGTVLGPGMNGPSEPTTSPGTGYGTVLYDNVAHTLKLDATFSGLATDVGQGTTASHIHAATTLPFQGSTGVATTTPSFVGFPLHVTSGDFHNTLDLTLSGSWNSAYITANGGSPATAEVALASALATGRSYWNIHSDKFPGGEIRGFLQLVVPEPASCLLLVIGLAGFACGARRR
jgi:CHRD domain